ncbi:notch-regulated ankyrin repeat-containing protein B-like [Galendromus occidentalis]|uniref:Notch-regulated ankyrin repeat-containing protein B-like n=1 Tax=Galendromus occidentalis TaxID=34638 RepID=A0AAJ6QSY5_9ACAR|nr:notch-regulated ankyrin repeat-containing protein B-like [Galendromus occidentalis]
MTPTAELVVPTHTSTGSSAINQILRSGDTNLLLKLLSDGEVGEINVNVFDREGMTPLHKSVMDGNFELVKLLVKVGADVRLASRDGWNALHIASFGGHVNIVDYLINCSVHP